ncbi:MAG: cytochrome c oxidase subunit 3 [Alphaproteobacteria bacterium]|nr:cytochrome c oxidase subunit 3 [Alphaproteobacteria bacterium]MBV9965391.1 cytochrome c oxidase subunit 3 [Alphaproteobacteria bacterium]
MPSAVLHPEEQYATLAQQGETAQLGMWVFLATETLFFGALIFTYFVYRNAYPREVAEAAKDTVLWCGSVNLGLLLTSSLTMVLAINAAAQGRPDASVRWLLATLGLGALFLGIKGYEYYLDYDDQVVPALNFLMKPGQAPVSELFWVYYFMATGLHAIHMSVGVGLVAYMVWKVSRGDITPAYYAPIEVVGLYWSFVDTVWIFLFPTIYLPGRS